MFVLTFTSIIQRFLEIANPDLSIHFNSEQSKSGKDKVSCPFGIAKLKTVLGKS